MPRHAIMSLGRENFLSNGQPVPPPSPSMLPFEIPNMKILQALGHKSGASPFRLFCRKVVDLLTCIAYC